MGIVQKDGRVLYSFGGMHRIAQQEALSAILKHEKIPFEPGVGPTCAIIEVAPEHSLRVREVVQQWYEAMHAIHRSVWDA